MRPFQSFFFNQSEQNCCYFWEEKKFNTESSKFTVYENYFTDFPSPELSTNFFFLILFQILKATTMAQSVFSPVKETLIPHSSCVCEAREVS